MLAGANLGDGGLLPFPIYQEDLSTPVDGKFYCLNFGARKNTFRPSESKNVELLGTDSKTGTEVWKVNSWAEDGDVALSAAALTGADLWGEETIRSKLFMSEALVAALRETNVKIDFRLKQCRIVGSAQ